MIFPAGSNDSSSTRRTLLWLALLIVVHVGGRITAIGGPGRFDSTLYAVAADRLWSPDASPDHLIPDKPPGQSILTGWCFRVAPGDASRLVLVPIESAFLLGAILLLFALGTRLWGAALAGPIALIACIAHQAYQSTDGFNLNESYLALPALAAVAACLLIERPELRGLTCGIAVAVALSIKQSAAAVTLAIALHAAFTLLRSRDWPAALRTAAGAIAGVALVWGPMALRLANKGLLKAALAALTAHAGQHLGVIDAPPSAAILVPLAALAWLALAGLLLLRTTPPRGRRKRDPLQDALTLSAAWFALELGVIFLLPRASPHYWQQVVSPLALLAGTSWATLAARVPASTRRAMQPALRGIEAVTLALALAAAAGFLPNLPQRWRAISLTAEQRQYAAARAASSPRSLFPTEEPTP